MQGEFQRKRRCPGVRKVIFMLMMVGVLSLSFAQAERDVQIIENEIEKSLLGTEFKFSNFKLR